MRNYRHFATAHAATDAANALGAHRGYHQREHFAYLLCTTELTRQLFAKPLLTATHAVAQVISRICAPLGWAVRKWLRGRSFLHTFGVASS
jgi:hypothetical protein